MSIHLVSFHKQFSIAPESKKCLFSVLITVGTIFGVLLVRKHGHAVTVTKEFQGYVDVQ